MIEVWSDWGMKWPTTDIYMQLSPKTEVIMDQSVQRQRWLHILCLHRILLSCLFHGNVGINDPTLGHWHPKKWPHHHGFAATQWVEFKLAVLSIRHSTTWHHLICQTMASSCHQLPPSIIRQFKCTFTVSLLPVHFLEIEHLLLPDHAFRTVFLHMSVNLICLWTPSSTNWKCF